MVERIESSEQTGTDVPPVEPTEPTDGRPANVPEKFWDAENKAVRTDELLKSYTELEASKQAPGLPSDGPTDPAKPAEGDDPPKPTEGDGEGGDEAGKAAADAAKSAGVDMNALEAEFMENGKLSDERYTELEGKGFARGEIDEFIEFRTAKADRYMAELHGEVGGEEQFDTMATWASENWSEGELKEYNAAVDSQDMGRAKIAMKGLRSDFEKANGVTPKLLDGDGGSGQSGSTYRSDAEMHRDMQDPRYKTDPAFRQDVVNKVDRTQKFLGQT